MTKIYNTIKLIVFAMVLFSAKLGAQCTSPNAYGTFTANSAVAPQYIIGCSYAQEYNTIEANYLGAYTFTVTNGSGTPIYLTLKDGLGNNVAFGGSPLTYNITTPGIYYLHITETGPTGCLMNTNCHDTYIEVVGAPGSPTVTSAPVNTLICENSSTHFSVTALPTGVTYQWQENSGAGFVNITNGGVYSGANSNVLLLTGVPGSMNMREYRCIVTNTVNSDISGSAMLYVIDNAVVPIIEDFESSFNMPNNWYDPNYTWYVQQGHGTNNSNGMTRNLYDMYSTYADVTTSRVGPITASTSITFDYRIVDYSNYPSTATPTTDIANDSLNVYVSNNCGLTYTLLGSVNASNHVASLNFLNVGYQLGAYAGSDLTFRFKATKDPSTPYDYFVDVDNINIFNLTAVDGGVSAISSPSASGCYTNMEPVVVTITNFGTGPIFAIPVSVVVSGPISQTITGMYTNAIPVGASAVFTVGTVNMSYGGVYTFTSTTVINSDGNSLNDIHVITRTVSPLTSVIGPGEICIGNSATLTVGGNPNTYTWSTGVTTSSIVVTPSATTVYTVNGTDLSNCSAAGALTLTVIDPTITASGSAGCGVSPSGTISVNAFQQGNVSWYSSPTSTTVLQTGSIYTLTAASTSTFYAEATSTATNALFTTLDAGNGYSGNMFDITALSTLTLNAVDMHFDYPGTTTVEVWYRPGSFVGFESANTGWTMAHTATLNTLGYGVLTPIPGTFAIPVPAGQTYGIYVTTVDGNPQTNYTNGTNVGNMYASNADLQFFEGNGGGYFDVINSPRIFNGQLHYEREGCTSPKIPVVYTVTPNTVVNAAASATTVCAGDSIVIIASGANNYTWSPGGQTTSTITLYPSSTITAYTVVGAVNSCTGSATGQLSFIALPELTVTASAETICTGNSATLDVTGAATYSWSQGAATSSIVVSPTISTIYSLTAQNDEGCVTDTTYNLNVVLCVGIGKNTLIDGNTFVYPNPNSGVINVVIDANITAACALQIFDVAGKEVYYAALKGNTASANIKDLANGLYTYKITNSDNKNVIKNGKIIKE